jgi:hypothetical protein
MQRNNLYPPHLGRQMHTLIGYAFEALRSYIRQTLRRRDGRMGPDELEEWVEEDPTSAEVLRHLGSCYPPYENGIIAPRRFRYDHIYTAIIYHGEQYELTLEYLPHGGRITGIRLRIDIRQGEHRLHWANAVWRQSYDPSRLFDEY